MTGLTNTLSEKEGRLLWVVQISVMFSEGGKAEETERTHTKKSPKVKRLFSLFDILFEREKKKNWLLCWQECGNSSPVRPLKTKDSVPLPKKEKWIPLMDCFDLTRLPFMNTERHSGTARHGFVGSCLEVNFYFLLFFKYFTLLAKEKNDLEGSLDWWEGGKMGVDGSVREKGKSKEREPCQRERGR